MNRTVKSVLVLLIFVFIGGIIFFIINADWLLKKQKSVQEQKNTNGKPINVILVNSQKAHIQLNKSKDKQIRISLNAQIPVRDHVQLQTQVEKERLVIEVKYKHGENPFSLSSSSSAQLNISIPSKMYEKIQLQSDQGNIQTSDIHSYSFAADSGSGSMLFKRSQMNSVSLETKDSKFRLHNNQGKTPSDPPMYVQQINASNGNVSFDHLKARNQQLSGVGDNDINVTFHDVNVHSMSLTTFSGKLHISDFHGNSLYGKLNDTRATLKRITANLGLEGNQDITVDQLYSNRILSTEITSNEGDIRVHLAEKPKNFYVSLQTTEGKIETNLPIKRDTKYGSYSGNKSIIGSVALEQPKLASNLILSTETGNIQLEAP